MLASEGPVLILAGAGSGKTRVITHRIAHLVVERNVPSESLLAVTFTNKAAAEMKARAEALVESEPLRSWISTFHSLCVRVLRREGDALAVGRNFVIYDEADQLQAVKQAMRSLGLREKLYPPRRLLSWISARKNSHTERGDEDAWDGEGSYAAVASAYRKLLLDASALDFDDLLLETVALFARREDIRDRYRERFQYLLVDEYQDTNGPQYELVRHLAGERGNLTVVGDEDQSIYSWRGARLGNILDFESDFPGARVLRLEDNYRSTQIILDAAAGLVAHNRERKGKTLRATREGGEPLRIHQASDEYDEAAWVADQVARFGPPGRAAVLYRTNSQSRVFEEALRRRRIEYMVYGGVGFYERKEIKDVLAYLRLVLNPDDPMAFRRVVNVPPRGLGAKALENLARLAQQRGTSLTEAARAALRDSLVPGRSRRGLERFVELLDALREEARSIGLQSLIQRTLELSGYLAALGQEESHDSQDRLENLAELLSAAADYEAREDVPSLAGFLDKVSLLSDLDQPRGDAPVLLMTLHSAKGLEFETVLLAGLEEGLVPHSRSLQNDRSLEEERRLCYVGMTRAKQRLLLSSAKSRQVFGQRRVQQVSRFIEEIPKDGAELSGDQAAFTPRQRFSRSARSAGTGPPRPGAAPAGLRAGARVRHPLFGVGTVLRADGRGEALKVTVAFAGAGTKRLVARYAALELVS